MPSDLTVGRPTKYRPEFDEQARKLCKIHHATDLDLAQWFNVNVATIHRWKAEHDSFCESVNAGKEQDDDAVERALFKRATGYSFDAVKIVTTKEDVHEVPYIEHVPPDTKAAQFWLMNRRRAKWAPSNAIEPDAPKADPSNPQGLLLVTYGPPRVHLADEPLPKD